MNLAIHRAFPRMWRVWRHTFFNPIHYITRCHSNVNPIPLRSVTSFMDDPNVDELDQPRISRYTALPVRRDVLAKFVLCVALQHAEWSAPARQQARLSYARSQSSRGSERTIGKRIRDNQQHKHPGGCCVLGAGPQCSRRHLHRTCTRRFVDYRLLWLVLNGQINMFLCVLFLFYLLIDWLVDWITDWFIY